MTGNDYSKDKNAVFRWIISGIGIAGITIAGGIYNKMDAFAEFKIKTELNMQYKDLKDKEQDRRLDVHDEVLYLKPEDVALKFKREENKEE